MSKYIVTVKSSKNGRILDAFGMKQEGFAFFFQNEDGEWINPAFGGKTMSVAFKILFKDSDDFLWSSKTVFEAINGKYKVIVREL